MRSWIAVVPLWALPLSALAQDTDAQTLADDAPAPEASEGPAPPPPPPPPPEGGASFFVDPEPDAGPPPPEPPQETSSLFGDAPEQQDKARFSWQLGGILQYDLRFRPIQYEYGTFYQDIENPPTVERNELMSRLRGNMKYGSVGAVADVELVLRAFPTTGTLNDLSIYNLNTPFRIHPHDLYLYKQDLFKGFDVRIGQQKVMFGVGDQFNPTNNINPNRFEDLLLFGDQMGNLMVRMDYTPRWNISMTGILIPIFKPALLPRTAYLGQQTDRYPYLDDQTRWNFAVEQELGAGRFPGAPIPDAFPTIVRDTHIALPDFAARNMQGFFRVGGLFGPVDVALSYYRGFSDIPQAGGTRTSQIRDTRCEFREDIGVAASDRQGACVDGVLANDVTLTFPRMHVLGLNLAGEAKLGYRFEFAMVFPEEVRNEVYQDNISFSAGPLGTIVEDGPYAFRDAQASRVVDTTPFPKWVLGLDYTFGKHVMMNLMWVHGFPDEFGAGDSIVQRGAGFTTQRSGLIDDPRFGDCVQLDFSGDSVGRSIDGRRCVQEVLRPRIGDYAVIGFDVNFAAQRGLFRLFTIWDLTGLYFDTWDHDVGDRVRTYRHAFTQEGFSAIIYPSLMWDFGRGFEMHAGALLQLGESYTKFGAPENGGHLIWTRARFSF